MTQFVLAVLLVVYQVITTHDAHLVTYDCGGSGVYFDVYKGEEIIIFDDCEDIAQPTPFRAAIKLFDTTPCKWQVKHKAPVTVMAKKARRARSLQ